MKTIIRENYYHRKLWDEACLECELKKDKTLQSLDGENVNDQLQARYYEELQRVLRDMQASQRSRPSWIGRLKFKLSSIISIKVARHNEMNIHIQASDTAGVIELVGNDIMSDTDWKDGKQKILFLLLFLFAHGVCVQSKTESNNTFISIHLSYHLMYHFCK